MKTVKLIDKEGVTRNGRKVVVSTTFNTDITDIWQRVQNVSTLTEICKPMAKFSPCNGIMPKIWDIGKKYTFKFYLHGIIPMGIHTICIESMNENKHEIQSREYNTFVPVWNHLVKMETINKNTVRYTDEIDIYANNGLTGLIAWWTVRFYKHKQKKWHLLLNK